MATPKSTLQSGFSVPFGSTSGTGADKKSIALTQVEGTLCEDIEFILYNKKSLNVTLETTAGTYHRLASVFTDKDEVVFMNDSQAVGVGTPGVISVKSIEVIGDVLHLGTSDSSKKEGHFVFDMEMEEIKYTGSAVFAVLRIQYRSKGMKYKFNWPADKTIKDAIIVGLASDKSKASIQVSREDCTDQGEQNKYGEESSKDNQLQFTLEMETSWSIIRNYNEGSQKLGAMLYMYPVHSSGTPELKATFGKSGTSLECSFSEEPGFPAFRQLSESLNFSSSGIANVRCFVGSWSDFSIAAASTFYDTKGNRIMSPNFKIPGDYITVEEYRDVSTTVKDPLTGQDKQVTGRIQVRSTKQLGPTEVAVVSPVGVLLPAIGVARVNYKVPMKVGVIKLDVPLTQNEIKNWQCTVYGSYLYDMSALHKPIIFMGQASISSPMGSSPALDAREQAIKEKIAS